MQVHNFSKKKYFALKRTRDHFPVMLRRPRTNERELKQRDDDGNENGKIKKPIWLVGKTATLNVHHTFFYISLPLLHD